jgi:hypothetical protein
MYNHDRMNMSTKPRQHEAESRECAADAAARKHPEIDTELVRFRPRKDLVQREHAIEVLRADPLLFGDELVPDHRDLRDGTAPCEEAKLEKTEKQFAERLMRHVRGVCACSRRGGA